MDVVVGKITINLKELHLKKKKKERKKHVHTGKELGVH